MSPPPSDSPGVVEQLSPSRLTRGFELIFKNLTVYIDKRPILQDVTAMALPGEMLAIMGPSGAGKTTLLNCLAGRKPVDSGEITLNSKPLSKALRRSISYVLQSDIFLPQLSCWDTLWYTALLRLPGSMPESEKKERVYEIIDYLDMRKCLKTIIGGDRKRGLSGGEMKRTNIACELITNPALMFLDEPTSGLDSSTAYSLICTLKEFCRKSGKTVVVSIHQPSSQIFHMFDKLLLLCDGQVAYYGKVKHCSEFMSSIGMACPRTYNLSDFILEKLKDSEEVKSKMIAYSKTLLKTEAFNNTDTLDKRKPLGDKDSNGSLDMKHGMTSNGPTEVNTYDCMDTEQNMDGSEAMVSAKYLGRDNYSVMYRQELEDRWPTSFWLQFCVLWRRSLKANFPSFMAKQNIIQCLVVGTFIGMLWFQLPLEEYTIRDRQGLFFFAVVYSSFQGLLQSVASFSKERSVVNKERLGGYYRLSAYFMAKLFSETPLILALPFMLYTILFWLSGLNYDAVVYLQLLAIVLLSSLVAQAMGQFFGVVFTDLTIAVAFGRGLLLCLVISGGFYNLSSPEWSYWFKYLSFIGFAYYAALDVDYNNIRIQCAPEGSQFLACHNTTRVDNSTASLYIPVDALLDEFTLRADGFLVWHYIVILIALSLFPRIATYITLRYIRKPAQS